MRRIADCSLDEVIAEWLRQERASSRFSGLIDEVLNSEGLDPSVIEDGGEQAVERRRRVLELYRGYGTAEGQYLSGFPTGGLQWRRVALSADEALAIRFIKWSYWLELSGGSRMPRDAAARIRAGKTAFGASNDGFQGIAAAVRAGSSFPPLIAATTGLAGDHAVLVEGHARLTGYALAEDALPPELEVFLGISTDVSAWWAY